MLLPDAVRHLVVHCSATPDDDGVDVRDIHAMHLGFGWHGIGYHRVIERDGRVQPGRPEYWVGAHVYGHNESSLGVCLLGTERFTDAQLDALERVLREWRARYPDATACGHRDFSSTEKTCPNFDVGAWCAARGIDAGDGAVGDGPPASARVPGTVRVPGSPGASEPDEDRLDRQIDFLLAVDALKRVERASPVTGASRRENSAEHSWHVALCAQVLAAHANAPVDLARVTSMLLIHDIVEVDAGDLPLHAPRDPDRHATESAAAARLFGLLPGRQGALLEALWHEFEAGDGIDARFARAIDRLQPMLLNTVNDGGTWADYDVTREQLVRRTGHIAEGSETLWAYCERTIDAAIGAGWVRANPIDGTKCPGV